MNRSNMGKQISRPGGKKMVKKAADPYAEGMIADGTPANAFRGTNSGPMPGSRVKKKTIPLPNKRLSEIESMKKLKDKTSEDAKSREFGKKGSIHRRLMDAQGNPDESFPLRFSKGVGAYFGRPFAATADLFSRDTEPKEKSARPFRNGGMVGRGDGASRVKTKGKCI